jgi:hypothetical protein
MCKVDRSADRRNEAVIKAGAENEPARAGQFRQFSRRARFDGERLLTEDVFAGRERCAHLSIVVGVRRCDDYGIDARMIERFGFFRVCGDSMLLRHPMSDFNITVANGRKVCGQGRTRGHGALGAEEACAYH